MKRKKRAATFAARHFDDHWNGVCDRSPDFYRGWMVFFEYFWQKNFGRGITRFFLFSTREKKITNEYGSSLLSFKRDSFKRRGKIGFD